MAKTIKFNLICDGNPVRTIEDLQNNFSIEDILAYYNNKLLHRWLNVRGYEKELEAVNEIKDEEPISIIKNLISIFNIEIDEKTIKEDLYILDYLEERKELYSIYEQHGLNVQSVLYNYHTGYLKLTDDIIKNVLDIAKIKSIISEILDKYYYLFELDHQALFYKLFYHAPIAIFVLLTFEKARKFYLPIEVESEEEYDKTRYNPPCDIDETYNDERAILMQHKKDIYRCICAMSYGVLGDNLKTFGNTNGRWKTIEEKGKKYMILSISFDSFVRSSEKPKENLSAEDVIDQFVILDGISFKSNSASHTICYMEV